MGAVITSDSWCDLQPCIDIGSFIISQPTSSIIVLICSLYAVLLAFKIMSFHKFWSLSLMLGGVAAIFAGFEYQAFGYEIKCAGQEYCDEYSIFSIIYNLLTMLAFSIALFALAKRYQNTFLKHWTYISFLCFAIITTIAYLERYESLLGFNFLIVSLIPSMVIALNLLIANRDNLTKLLLQSICLIVFVILAYFLYFLIGLQSILWSNGVWISSDDILHIGMIIWLSHLDMVVFRKWTHHDYDVFSGRITSSSFSSGDVIVVGYWQHSPFGEFCDIMWSKPDGTNVLIAPTSEVANYVSEMYDFDEIITTDIEAKITDKKIIVDTELMELDFNLGYGISHPLFMRPLWFVATIEYFFGRLFFGTKTHGSANNSKEEWYVVDRYDSIKDGSAVIEGIDLGECCKRTRSAKFGFSEAPIRPASVKVRTFIK
jgi:hypothetical protein|tara:strand:+ start:181 stop:1470 length:1290 start_codon:yes stop_codon:yes gene_type:complete